METFCYLVDVHEGSCCVCQDVLVTDCENGVLPVDGHQRGLRVQHDVGVSVLLVPVQVDQRSHFVVTGFNISDIHLKKFISPK